MDVCGYVWISIQIHGCLWISMDSMDIHVYLWRSKVAICQVWDALPHSGIGYFLDDRRHGPQDLGMVSAQKSTGTVDANEMRPTCPLSIERTAGDPRGSLSDYWMQTNGGVTLCECSPFIQSTAPIMWTEVGGSGPKCTEV
jgi:hypothetical protein